MRAGTHGDTWQNGPPLEWLAKIARPPTPAQDLAGPKLPSLGAISEEPELHLSSSGQSAPQVPSLSLVDTHTPSPQLSWLYVGNCCTTLAMDKEQC